MGSIVEGIVSLKQASNDVVPRSKATLFRVETWVGRVSAVSEAGDGSVGIGLEFDLGAVDQLKYPK